MGLGRSDSLIDGGMAEGGEPLGGQTGYSVCKCLFFPSNLELFLVYVL